MLPQKTEFSEEQLLVIDKHANGKTYDELLLIAQDLSYNKQYKTARLLCDYILNAFPNYTDARILKGRTLAWQQNYMKSEIELLNALKRSPYYDDAYLAILDMYWWSGQEEKSVDIYEQALKNDMINSDISFKMAKAHQRMDKVDEANKIVDSLIQIHPNISEYKTFKTSLQ